VGNAYNIVRCAHSYLGDANGTASISDRHTARKLSQPVTAHSDILNRLLRFLALHRVLCRLNLQHLTVGVRTLAAWQSIHGLLERVVFPAEEVVTMLSVTRSVCSQSSLKNQEDECSPIAKAVHKRLLVVTVPCVVLVPAGVPHNLVHHLRNGYRMCAGTVWCAKTSAVGVCDVALMIWRIKVFAVPARRKDDSRSDTARTVLVRQFCSVFCVAGCEAFSILQASMADACAIRLLRHRVTRDHAEPRLEGRHLVVLRGVRHVVYRHATVLLESYIGELWHTLERTVLRRLEVKRSSPVVAEVLAVCAGRTGRACGRIEDPGLHLEFVSGRIAHGSGGVLQ